MRISTRHLISARLLLLLAAALLLLLPGTAFARGVAKPSRSLAKPARATAKPKPGKKAAHRTQRVVIKQVPKRATKKPAKKTAEADRLGDARGLEADDAAGAGRRASRRWRSRPDLGGPDRARGARRPSPPSVGAHGRPDARAGCAGHAAAGRQRRGAIRVIVYGAGAQAALASVRATDVTSLPLISAFAATIKASTLGQLGLATGVTRVVVDSPVKATDSAPRRSTPRRSSPSSR